MGSDPTGAFGAVRRRPWVSLLALLTVLSAALLLTLRANIGFFLDDWGLVIYREGSPTDWLLPHNEHIVVIPAALFKLSLTVFGMTAFPLHLLGVAAFLISVWLLFFWLRPLIGEAASVLGCSVLLFLGAAAEDLIWAFQIGFFGSVAAGLAALLLLRKKSLRGDVLACLLLVISLLFTTLAIPFAVGAATHLLFRDGLRPDWKAFFRRSWVFLIPAALYIVWWAGWGHLAPNSLSLHNAIRVPLYVLSALGYAGASLTGPFPLREIVLNFIWALPGLLVAGAFALLLHRRRQVPVAFLVAAAMALTFWVLSGLNYIPGREFASSRYQYPSVIFLLMLLGGAFAGLRPDRRILKWMATIAVLAIAVNVTALIYTFNDRYKDYEERGLISLTAFDISSETVSPEARVGISLDDVAQVDAEAYLTAVDKYGSPGLSEEEIDKASEEHRDRLDQILVSTLPVQVLPRGEVRPDRARCKTIAADEEVTDSIKVESSLLFIESEQKVVIRLGRFGSGTDAAAWQVSRGRPIGYLIPDDNSDRPWRIGFQGDGKVTVCPGESP
jgi:hypothetical protein